MTIKVVADPKDGIILLNKLQLIKHVEISNYHPDITISDIHRAFHYEVVRWLQAQGFKVLP